MSKPSSGTSPWIRSIIAAGWLVAGFLLAWVLLLDPWDWHSLDQHLTHGAGPPIAMEDAATGQLWTCGMHPQVVQEEPGQCPICHMNLTPLELEVGHGGVHDGHVHPEREPEAAMSVDEIWTCPMHPHIAEHGPGSCPICGMDLVAKKLPAVEGAASAAPGERTILFYRHPMDPTISSPVAAKDSMGMDYVPVYAEKERSRSTTVRIDPVVVQNMNVRTAVVERRDLRHPIRTVGYLEYDQERMVSVTTKYSGWVEKVYVNQVGEPVKKGQPLFEIYSPELVQTQQELLSALEFARRMTVASSETHRRAEGLVEAARTRLRYWDIDPEQIAKLEDEGVVFRTLTVTAPASGLVMKRAPGLEGMGVKPGMETFHIADLSSLWLTVEVFEDQVAWVREGTPVEVRFTYFPGETFRSAVRFIEPEFSEVTRTLRVKIAVPNRDRRLRAGMYATVILEPQAVAAALTVPAEAVLRTGQRSVAIVALDEQGFSPRELVLGYQGEGFVEVLEGLREGERVVTSAQFLLDSEASLREAIQKMIRRETVPEAAPSGVAEQAHAHGPGGS